MELYDFLKTRVQSEKGYIKYNHLTFTELGKGRAKAEVAVDEDLLNPMGSVHGGCLFSVCDTVGGTAAMTHGAAVTTTMGTISYLNPAIGCGRLYAEAVELKAGKTLFRYDVFIRDENGKLICKADMEYYVLGKLEY
ncbi:MAG: PaaI family thioesterase [Lachnospiraceae bacterium]|nr:PaaI family thioesterase [Lachnospiraceae bacterium]